jgi:hypothetical protein
MATAASIDRSVFDFFVFAAVHLLFRAAVRLLRTEVAPARAALTRCAHVGCSTDTTCAAAHHTKMTDAGHA